MNTTLDRVPRLVILPRAAAIVNEYETNVTLRQLHYRLVSEPELGYLNTKHDYGLSERTAEQRREGSFPRLVDLTRSVTEPSSWTSPKAGVLALARQYRRRRTEGQAIVPVLLVEKATLSTLMRVWFSQPLGIASARRSAATPRSRWSARSRTASAATGAPTGRSTSGTRPDRDGH